MPTQVDSLLKHVDSFDGLQDQVYSNILKGAQHGIGPRLAYIDSATPLVFPNAIIITTHTPTMMDNIPYAKEILCTLFESSAQRVENIDPELTIGELDGPKLQNKQTVRVPGSSGVNDVNPSFTWREVPGNLIYRFFSTWVKMLCHPDTGYSQLGSLFKSGSIDPFILSYYSADILVIQPDITLQPQNIIDSFFISGLWPKSTGGTLGIKRDIGGDPETKERTIEFSGFIQWNANTFKIGQMVTEMLGLHTLNFDYAAPLSEGIEDQLKDSGITKSLEEMKQEVTMVA